MKEIFKITREYAGKKGFLSVQGGVFSESNINTWDSKIFINGVWYGIPNHIDDYEFKNLIQTVTIEYKKIEFGENIIKKTTFSNRFDNCPVRVLWDKSHVWNHKPKVGDVFTDYGIELDLTNLFIKYRYYKEKIKPESIVSYSIEWSKLLGINQQQH